MCKHISTVHPTPQIPDIPFDRAATLLRDLEADFTWLKVSLAGNTCWVQSLGKFLAKLSEKTVEVGLDLVKRKIEEEGHEKALAWINGVEHLPGLMSQCKGILADHSLLSKLAQSPVPDDLGELAREIGNFVTLTSYDQPLLQAVLPKDLAEGVDTFFTAVYESMKVAMANCDSEMTPWVQLVSKYRPFTPSLLCSSMFSLFLSLSLSFSLCVYF